MPGDLTVIRERCSVTAFDMVVELSRDGRERGLWIMLDDKSEFRSEMYKKWLDGAISTFVRMMGYKGEKDEELKKFSAWMSLDTELRGLASGKVSEGVLLEWPAIEKFHKAMGKAIRNGKLAEKLMNRKENERCLPKSKTNANRASSTSGSRTKATLKTKRPKKTARRS